MKEARKRAGFTQEYMASLMHRSRSSVVKMERDQQAIEVNDFVRWMKLTNAQDLMVAATLGMDITTLQPVIEVLSKLVTGLIILL
ncbi:helix-turn-helix transcriptional regulator [Paenalkalicoccus suaedae]|uniref:Helix-turn-helix transcriptional regulator n=2 Tax=Paenalkalicoccus suaedae TaxID=2592382 RepID=A0A859FBL9_9BACI|nr:helix-turn-helix transcriptional regulator [Paenalkalicoccus suaedae]